MLIKPAFSQSAKDILRDRYLWRDENRNPIEKPEEMLERVANSVAAAEGTLALQYKWADEFYDIMARLLFLPNSPTLMNAGRPAPHGRRRSEHRRRVSGHRRRRTARRGAWKCGAGWTCGKPAGAGRSAVHTVLT